MIKERNWKMIEECAPYLYSDIEDYTKSKRPNELIEIIDQIAYDGSNYLCIQFDNKSKRINSMYSPSSEAQIWAMQYSPEAYGRNKRVIIMFGMGNGYFVRELLKVMSVDESIILYEPCNEVFTHVVESYDITDILSDERLFLVVDEINHQDLEGIFRRFEVEIMRGQGVLIPHPCYEALFQDKLVKFMNIYNDIYISAVMNCNTASVYGEKWAEAEVANLPTIFQSDLLEECQELIPENVPVILVASGPSLNKNATMLKKAKGKALIMAVDSAVKYMYHFGVEPDFIVSVDVIKLISHFQNPIAMNTPMFLSVMANPNVVTLNNERKIFFDNNQLIKEIMGINRPIAKIVGAGSVATSAFVLATYLGAKTIILVGQDLSFQGNASHALGDCLQKSISTEYGELIEANDGTMVKTRYDWYKYLCWYNEIIPKFEGTVINATEGGAKIKGTKIMTLEDAIDTYCNAPYDQKQFFEDLDERKKEEGHVSIDQEKRLKNGIQKYTEQLQRAQGYVEDGIAVCNRIIEMNKKSKEESYAMKNEVKKLLNINSEINNMPINGLLEKYTYSTTMSEYKTLFVRYKDAQRNREHVYQKTKSVYESMRRATITLLQKIEQIRNK